MVKRYKGGLMGSTEATTSTSDSRGMWGTVQATQARNTGNWAGLLATETPGLGSGAGFASGFMTVSNVAVTDSNYTVLNDTPNISTTGGFIRVTGRGFVSGCVVYVGGVAATSTTFISSTEVRAQIAAATSNTLMVYVVNPDGSTGIKLSSLVFSGTPTWTTGATLSGQVSDVSFSIFFSATSDSAVSYALTSGSSLPPGTSLFANGLFTGTVTGISSDTTYSFSVDAIDTENQDTARTFSVTFSTGDQYFYLTSALLNGEANVWIRDSSVNNLLPTVGNDTKPTAFGPYNSNWSAYFDGTNDYLAYTYNTTFGTGDFTVECWVWMPVVTNTYSSEIIGTQNYSGVDRGWALEILGANGYPRFNLYNSSGTGVTTTSSTVLPANQWTHLAAVRSGTTVTIYMNGVSVASGTNATTDNFSNSIYVATNSTSFAIGVSTYSYAGYISNARVVVGVAVYTGNFTPPTTPLSNTQSAGTNIAAITGTSTSLLTLQDNRFKDNSSNAFAVTPTGDVAIRSFGPFVDTDTTTGSAYFDGTGDHLIIADNTAMELGAGDFCVECWIYPTSVSNTAVVIDKRSGGYAPILLWRSGSTLQLYMSINGSSWLVNGVTVGALVVNRWFHAAIYRVGSSIYTAFNGTVTLVTASGSGTMVNNATNWYIGTETNGSTNPWTGYIADMRFVVGSGVYTAANFTPATSSLSSITNTQFLSLQYRTGENNHRFIDESGFKNVMLRAGNATQGTFSPFSPAGWSAFFNGASDFLSIPANAAFNNLSGTTFTFEFWMYPTAFASGALYNEGRTIFSTAATFPNGWRVELTTTSITWYDYVGSTRISYAVSINMWTHVAFTYSSNNLIMYINGLNRGSASSVTWNNSSGTALIGALNSGSYIYYYQGYISNLRLVAELVYTGNFTPQTSSLTVTQSSGSNIAAITTGQTVFLTAQSNRFIDANTTPKTITIAAGTPRIQAFSPFRGSGFYSPSTHGASAYFDGTGDAVYSATAPVINFSTDDFTVEYWVYPTVSTNAYVQHVGAATTAAGIAFGSGTSMALYATTSTTGFGGNLTVVVNQWNHIAWSRQSGILRGYVNGAVGYSASVTTSFTETGVSVGAATNGSTYPFTGYISDHRVLRGNAVYTTSSITVPTSPSQLTPNVTLKLSFTHGGIVDATTRNIIETVGDAKIANVQSKFGSGALYFDGTGDYLSVVNTPQWDFGSDNFTIEFWTYITAYTSDFKFVIKASSVSNYWQFNFNNGGTIGPNFNYNNAAAGQVIVAQQGNTTGWATNTWYHVALVRNGTAVNIYKDGVSVASGTLSGALLNPSAPVVIGGSNVSTSPLNGYIDDFRTSRFARYTANFTPPTSAFLTR